MDPQHQERVHNDGIADLTLSVYLDLKGDG
jgi:hypothetical protein